MTRLRTSRCIATGLLLVIVLLCSSCSPPEQPTGRPNPATVDADCAPWDGAAFTVTVPYGGGDSIRISIYHAPDFKRPTQFMLPEEIGKDGNATYQTAAGEYQMLRGRIWFDRVESGRLVEGSYVLETESEAQFSGRFVATWGTTGVPCG
jgi:hypothetical protein